MVKNKRKERLSLLKDNRGINIVLSIFVAFLLIVVIILINMSLGPVLMEVIHVTNVFMADNPSDVAGDWRVSLNSSLRFYSASTFIICMGILCWMFINSIKREWKTYYR